MFGNTAHTIYTYWITLPTIVNTILVFFGFRYNGKQLTSEQKTTRTKEKMKKAHNKHEHISRNSSVTKTLASVWSGAAVVMYTVSLFLCADLIGNYLVCGYDINNFRRDACSTYSDNDIRWKSGRNQTIAYLSDYERLFSCECEYLHISRPICRKYANCDKSKRTQRFLLVAY